MINCTLFAGGSRPQTSITLRTTCRAGSSSIAVLVGSARGTRIGGILVDRAYSEASNNKDGENSYL